MSEHEKRMIELHRKHNAKYERYKKLDSLILKLDLFGRVSLEDLEEVDRRLKQRESCINQMQEAMELGEKVYPYEVLVLLGEIEDKELKSE